MNTPTINQIQTEILDTAAASADLPATSVLTESEQSLQNVTSTSKVSVWRLIVYVVSVSAWTLYKMFEIQRTDVDERMANYRQYGLPWFTDRSLEYQHGQELVNSNQYDNTGLSSAEIDALQIIAKASVVEVELDSIIYLRFKVARLVDGFLVALEQEQIDGFKGYIKKIAYPGAKLKYTSQDADDLKVHVKMYFDTSILDPTGARLDGADDTPVPNSLIEYLKSKNSNDFNGELSMDSFRNNIELVPGITDVFIQGAWSKYGGFGYDDINAQGNVGPITEFRQPESGYFNLDLAASNFEYLPRI